MTKLRIRKNKWLTGGLILFAISMIFGGRDFFTTLNSLTLVKGKVNNVELTYVDVESRRIESVKAFLNIRLKNNKSEYQIFKNIGKTKRSKKYEELRKKIEHSNTVELWIRESNKNLPKQKIYQIRKNEKQILYSLSEAKSN